MLLCCRTRQSSIRRITLLAPDEPEARFRFPSVSVFLLQHPSLTRPVVTVYNTRPPRVSDFPDISTKAFLTLWLIYLPLFSMEWTLDMSISMSQPLYL